MPSQPPASSAAYTLQSVRNALRIVRALQDRQELSVKEVATELGVGMSTAHRLLSTLKHESFVRQSPSTKKYLLGAVMMATLPAQLLEDYIQAARGPMRALVDAVGETSHLMVRDGKVVRFLHVEESQRLVRLTSRVGMTLPVHAASGGKVLLTHLSAVELNHIFPNERLSPLTSDTVESRARLYEELVSVKEQGYATNLQESEPDVFAVSAPIVDQLGLPIASISLAGPTSRFTEAQLTEPLPTGPTMLQALLDTARDISEALG